MATRCNVGQHATCHICNRSSPASQLGHVHEFNRASRVVVTICGPCYHQILISARLVLEALEAAGLHFSNVEELHELIATRVTVLVQGSLDLFAAGLN